MNICSYLGHEEIVYYGTEDDCPLCEALDEKQQLQDNITELKAEVSALKALKEEKPCQ